MLIALIISLCLHHTERIFLVELQLCFTHLAHVIYSVIFYVLSVPQTTFLLMQLTSGEVEVSFRTLHVFELVVEGHVLSAIELKVVFDVIANEVSLLV